MCDEVTAQSGGWQIFISDRMVRGSGDGCRDAVYLGKEASLSLGAADVGTGEFFVVKGAVLCIVGCLAAPLVLGARSSLLPPASLSCDNQQCL